MEYQKQLWLLFEADCNFVNSESNKHSTHDVNTSQVMNVCNPVLGNQFYGTIVNDPSEACTLNSNNRSYGNQNDRQISMNLQSHEYYNIDHVFFFVFY